MSTPPHHAKPARHAETGRGPGEFSNPTPLPWRKKGKKMQACWSVWLCRRGKERTPATSTLPSYGNIILLQTTDLWTIINLMLLLNGSCWWVSRSNITYEKPSGALKYYFKMNYCVWLNNRVWACDPQPDELFVCDSSNYHYNWLYFNLIITYGHVNLQLPDERFMCDT